MIRLVIKKKKIHANGIMKVELDLIDFRAFDFRVGFLAKM